VKKDKPEEEEWEQLPPELEETWPWWVEHRELQAALSHHPTIQKTRRARLWRPRTRW
jgi:hypothetical protein